ncbi:putative sugar O-methyltransferase [Micromonospora fluostatini]|uniref:putative sugar O-methyltransferase n=1 Tax=Micromonospora sp. JCM 30529 TaxID=3421643 RepID=UPI003D17899A
MKQAVHRQPLLLSSARHVLRSLGLTAVRTSSSITSYRLRRWAGTHNPAQPVPVEMARVLVDDNEELTDLRRRYQALVSPLRPGRFWRHNTRQRDFNLRYFRGDNAYVWQLRQLGENPRLKTYLYARYVAAMDERGLLGRLAEDGAFGCWTFGYRSLPLVSRDLLDSVNEIYFLDRHWGLLSREGYTVLDVGAGYGRLAHRMVEACPGLHRYLCVDAIAESTFLSRQYLRFRGVDDKAVVLDLDEWEEKAAAARPDLAVNVHSFSEMPMSAITAWIGRLARLEVPALLIVPNEGADLLSHEDDYARLDFSPVLAEHGYSLAASEPIIRDDDVRELTGLRDHFLLFVRSGADGRGTGLSPT